MFLSILLVMMWVRLNVVFGCGCGSCMIRCVGCVCWMVLVFRMFVLKKCVWLLFVCRLMFRLMFFWLCYLLNCRLSCIVVWFVVICWFFIWVSVSVVF